MEVHKSVEEREFKCTECDHSATSMSLLKLHMNSHTGERPFVCDKCGESYKRPSNLRRHKKSLCKPKFGTILGPTRTQEEIRFESTETVIVNGDDIIIEQCEEFEIEDHSTGNEMETGPLEEGEPEIIIDELSVVEEGVVEDDGIVEDDCIQYETHLISI